VAFAVSFIPIAGPLISCIIDGTFVDMFSAIMTGNWAMLGMCALAFVPGAGKLAKVGLKSLEKSVVKGMEKTVIKKGTRLYRVGSDVEKHGSWYTQTPMKGLSRQEIKPGTNVPTSNPATTLYEFTAKKDFVAYAGRSENAGVFDEVFIPGRGNDDILSLLSKIPTRPDL